MQGNHLIGQNRRTVFNRSVADCLKQDFQDEQDFLAVGAVSNRALPIADVGVCLRLSVGCDRLIATCSGSGDPELQGQRKGLEDLNVYRTSAQQAEKVQRTLISIPSEAGWPG